MSSLRDIIRLFGMERHHLAGWYAPHYADGEAWGPPRLSSMYVLLAGDEPVPLHKLEGIEVWHYYLGAPAEMIVTNGSRMHEVSLLGCDLTAGQRPQLAVPAHFWHACRSLGDWTLFGCTLSPGYSPHSPFVLNTSD
ncbi:cupin domain-containing protein [Caballeronia sp. LZ034LL]|uniref:cupin domain-containing protein n=1 Tax=Caballeronia sp. LZ034LL TaxID=3038567 RepID=UPI0028677614|nr:cupin domain-containing protein [Caballeronia sp. LZ034LL]MDR5839030.1 cupin domain-containing protein [Caballeronia sp. LZ034LL]